eukprot:6550265-Pyramimonas_sp.AAC.1
MVRSFVTEGEGEDPGDEHSMEAIDALFEGADVDGNGVVRAPPRSPSDSHFTSHTIIINILKWVNRYIGVRLYASKGPYSVLSNRLL